MSGLHRLSAEALRKSSVRSIRCVDLNFGLIAMLLLATLAIVVTVMFPDVILPALEFPGIGPL